MATWSIPFPNLTAWDGTTTEIYSILSAPAEFVDGSVINSITSTATLTSDGATDDTIEAWAWITNAVGVATVGGDSKSNAVVTSTLGPNVASDGWATNPAPVPYSSVVTRSDWASFRVNGSYTANMKSDNETASMPVGFLVIDYTPPSVAALEVESWRFSELDGHPENVPSWIAAERVPPVFPEGEASRFILRLKVKETSGVDSWVNQLGWRFKLNGLATRIPGTSPEFTTVFSAISVSPQDGSATTQQLGTGTFDSDNKFFSEGLSDGTLTGPNIIPAGYEAEICLAIQVSQDAGTVLKLVENDTIVFQLYDTTDSSAIPMKFLIDAPSLEGGPAITGPDAEDVESASEVSMPALGQEHGLTATSVESTSEISTPAIGQVYDVLANDVESGSEVSSPALVEQVTYTLLADDVESASEVSIPGITQDQTILAEDVESLSEVSVPSVGQEHGLLAIGVQSLSEVSVPTLVNVAGTDNLLADDVETTSEVSIPEIDQVHVLLSDSVESLSELTLPEITQDHTLLATSVEGNSEVSVPGMEGAHNLFAENVSSQSELTTPSLDQVHNLQVISVESLSEVSEPALFSDSEDSLLADDVESSSEVSVPTLAAFDVIYNLTAIDPESASEVSVPELQVFDLVDELLANDVEASSEVSAPELTFVSIVVDLFAEDAEISSELSTPAMVHIIGRTDLLADDAEAPSEVDDPSLGQVHSLANISVESASEVSIPLCRIVGDSIVLNPEDSLLLYCNGTRWYNFTRG